MTLDVTVKIVEATPTAVVAAATTWAEFPNIWGPMLGEVWSFLRGEAPKGLGHPGPSTGDFDVKVFWSLVAP